MADPDLSGFTPQPCDCGAGTVTPVQPQLFSLQSSPSEMCDTDPVTGLVYNSVLVQYEYDDEGNLTATRYVDAETGEPYVPLGTVQACSLKNGFQFQVLCEFKTDGTVTQFLRGYTVPHIGGTIHADHPVEDPTATYTVDPTSRIGLCTDEREQTVTYGGLVEVMPGGDFLAVDYAGVTMDSITLTVVEGSAVVTGTGTFPPISVPAGTSMSWSRATGNEGLGTASVLALTQVSVGVGSRALVHFTALEPLP